MPRRASLRPLAPGLAAALLAILALLAFPEDAWAWGPATHIFVGSEILRSLALLPPGLALLIRGHAIDFLYGCLAADITLGKKYVPAGRHCHHWPVGEEILEAATTDPLRACALGYLVHLAADTVAHNVFIPRHLVLTAATPAIGHSYWEHRMDAHVGDAHARLASRVVTRFDHGHADELFDRVLARSLLSFRTNKRIFRGMILIANHETWRTVFDRVVDRSRWDLEDGEVERYLRITFNYSMDYLLRRDRSVPASLDPVGEESLLRAKRLRRRLGFGRTQTRDALRVAADQHFPFPRHDLDYWNRRAELHPTPHPSSPTAALKQGRRRGRETEESRSRGRDRSR
ncbi:MAG: zinc dependent phospholipase C family protein [Gemmatimonadetes bacterium]|nr:zinc dependent phospholipase C family protein [Gemmatimonadota bacterium]